MADEAARRRELRRRRILENAEERKKKIFGTPTSNSTTGNAEENKPADAVISDVNPSSLSNLSVDGDIHSSQNDIATPQENCTPPAQSLPHLQNSSLGFESRVNNCGPEVISSFNDVRSENSFGSEPELTSEHLANISSLLMGSGGGNGSGFVPTQNRKLNTSDVQPATGPTVIGALSTPVVPVILALFVCVLLSVKLEYVVSNSISLPFLLWEVHHLWCNRQLIDASSQGMGGLMGLALVLCGVQQSVIRKLTLVITVVKCVFEDFAFYMLTIVIWHWSIGLPSLAVSPADNLAQSETIQVTAPVEDIDIFADMEDF